MFDHTAQPQRRRARCVERRQDRSPTTPAGYARGVVALRWCDPPNRVFLPLRRGRGIVPHTSRAGVYLLQAACVKIEGTSTLRAIGFWFLIVSVGLLSMGSEMHLIRADLKDSAAEIGNLVRVIARAWISRCFTGDETYIRTGPAPLTQTQGGLM